jgi:hypothetical protein
VVLSRPHTPNWRQGFARYRSQSANPGLRDGLRGAWLPLLGPTGLTLWDVSGWGNHATLTNMDPAAAWGSGSAGWALAMDGVNDYATIPGNPATNMGTSDFTLSAWVRTSFGGANSLRLMDKRLGPYGGGDTGYNMQLDGGLLSGGLGDGPNKIPDGTTLHQTPVNDGRWHHVAMVANRTGTVVGYVDGQSDGTAIDISSIGNIDTTAALLVGNNYAFGTFYDGSLRGLTLHKRALAPIEIRHLHRDLFALVRLRARCFPESYAGQAIAIGPFCVAAGVPYVTGAAIGQVRTVGSVVGHVHHSGGIAGLVA